jgi:hypothetical protein
MSAEVVNASERKYKNIFKNRLKTDFPMFVHTREESTVKCEICGSQINIQNGGRTALKAHLGSMKHKKALKSVKGVIDKKNEWTVLKCGDDELTLENRIRAAELTLSFHTVKHNQSFTSLSCTSKLNAVMYSDSQIAQKMFCGKTKAIALIKTVIAPDVVHKMQCELLQTNYLSISTDASKSWACQNITHSYSIFYSGKWN